MSDSVGFCPVTTITTHFEVIHSLYSHNIKHPLIIPTECTVFIHYIHLLYFSYMFWCHTYHHQGELLCPLLLYIKTPIYAQLYLLQFTT
jgi:hypothetical protein